MGVMITIRRPKVPSTEESSIDRELVNLKVNFRPIRKHSGLQRCNPRFSNNLEVTAIHKDCMAIQV